MARQCMWQVGMWLVLVVLTFASAVRAIEDFNDTLPAEVMEADDKVQIPWAELGSAVREGRGVVEDMATRFALECVLSGNWKCMQVKAVRALRLWLTHGVVEDSEKQQASNHVGGKEDEKDDNKEEEVGGGGVKLNKHLLLNNMAEALVEGTSAIFLADNEKERHTMVLRGSRALDLASYQLEEVSGRKKKIKKGITDLKEKILLLKTAIFTKISVLLQLKTFIVTKLMLIISAVQLLMKLSKSKMSSQSAPVIKIVQTSGGHDEEHEHSGSTQQQQYATPYAAAAYNAPYTAPYAAAHKRDYMAYRPLPSRKQQQEQPTQYEQNQEDDHY